LVKLSPDGLRLDRDHVGREGDEVVAGVADGNVASRRVHHLVGVHVADGTESFKVFYCSLAISN